MCVVLQHKPATEAYDSYNEREKLSFAHNPIEDLSVPNEQQYVPLVVTCMTCSGSCSSSNAYAVVCRLCGARTATCSPGCEACIGDVWC